MILLHTDPDLPRYFFEEKLKNFDYSLGTEVDSLANGADTLLFFDAEDHVWTAGRQALLALQVTGSILVGMATRGFVGIPVMSGGATGVRAALVDTGTGDILWINAVGSESGTDLRDPASARATASELFKDFPVSYDRQPKEQESR